MKNIKIENGKIYSESFGKTDVFEIVGRIPVSYQIWNIGENMGTHDYIPLCQDLHPEDKDDYSINPATLKAIRVTSRRRGCRPSPIPGGGVYLPAPRVKGRKNNHVRFLLAMCIFLGGYMCRVAAEDTEE